MGWEGERGLKAGGSWTLGPLALSARPCYLDLASSSSDLSVSFPGPCVSLSLFSTGEQILSVPLSASPFFSWSLGGQPSQSAPLFLGSDSRPGGTSPSPRGPGRGPAHRSSNPCLPPSATSITGS